MGGAQTTWDYLTPPCEVLQGCCMGTECSGGHVGPTTWSALVQKYICALEEVGPWLPAYATEPSQFAPSYTSSDPHKSHSWDATCTLSSQHCLFQTTLPEYTNSCLFWNPLGQACQHFFLTSGYQLSNRYVAKTVWFRELFSVDYLKEAREMGEFF